MFNSNKVLDEIISEMLDGTPLDTRKYEAKYNNKPLITKLLKICKENQLTREQVKEIIRNCIQLATEVSTFDLNLFHYSGEVEQATNQLNDISSHLLGAFEETTASMQQVANTISELSSTTEDISQQLKTIDYNINSSKDIVSNAQATSNELKNNSKNMEQDVNHLVITLEDMKKAIDGIGYIAEQTNLLALNASIEAARAGENGKGFSVVAGEVKKLSEETKNLLESMNRLVDDIGESSKKTIVSVDRTIKDINDIDSAIDSILNITHQNAASVSHISDNLVGLSSSSEKISASSQQVSAAMYEISTDAETLNHFTLTLSNVAQKLVEIGKSMNKVGAQVDNITHLGGKLANHQFYKLTNDDFISNIETAINAHRNWVKNLTSMVDDMEVRPIQTDEHKCGFGHFYYSITPTASEIIPLWKSVESIHSKLHRTGEHVIESIKSEDKQSAEIYLREAENLSKKIIEILNKMVESAKQMSNKGQLVF